MKKIKLMIALCALTSIAFCQAYGEYSYSHSNTFLSSGTIATLNVQQGFVMAGYAPTNTTGNPNFIIDRTDVGGAFNAATFEFSREYFFHYQSGSCGTGLSQSLNCKGVSLIETKLTTPTVRHYALAGSFSEGCFFATLNAAGIPVASSLYRFPTGAFAPTKPLIVESTTPGEYFIFGYYAIVGGGTMYALKINAAGTILFSSNFSMANSVSMQPMDIMLSPYSPTGVGEVVVVGKAIDNNVTPNFVTMGFFARFDITNLTNIQTSVYGQLPLQFGNKRDGFTAVNVANSNYGGTDGFIVGGYSDSTALYPLWMLKLDRTGNNIIWNNLFQPTKDDFTTNGPVSVLERFSGNYNHTYYAAMSSTVGMLVVKLDSAGNIFTLGPPIDNYSEFFYDNGGTPDAAADMSMMDNAAANDNGLHVFGTRSVFGSGFGLIKAAFNGYTEMIGCTNSGILNINNQVQGPPKTSTVGLYTASGLSRCLNFSITQNLLTTLQTVHCNTVSLNVNGSLNKTTATNEILEETYAISIFPNPVQNKVHLVFNALQGSKVKITLLNAMGQKLDERTVIELLDSGEQSQELDISKFDLSAGLFFIDLNIDGSSYKQKLIYQKD